MKRVVLFPADQPGRHAGAQRGDQPAPASTNSHRQWLNVGMLFVFAAVIVSVAPSSLLMSKPGQWRPGAQVIDATQFVDSEVWLVDTVERLSRRQACRCRKWRFTMANRIPSRNWCDQEQFAGCHVDRPAAEHDPRGSWKVLAHEVAILPTATW